ncbi:MAG TPA: hypothetical protein VJY62_16055 [Bacteroidia bacterium]|nr:hypothetical protein [Bacteroidia bacterium]
MKTLLFNAGLIVITVLMINCNQAQEKDEPSTQVKPEVPEPKETFSGNPELISDTIFLGFRCGMTAEETKKQVSTLKNKGEKINLSGNADKMSGEYILNNGKTIAKSQMTILFVKDKLSELQIEIKCNPDHSVTDALRDLAEYIATMHGPYQTDEDTEHYEYHFWDDGNRLIKISQSNGHVKAKCLYNIDFKDSHLDSFKQS